MIYNFTLTYLFAGRQDFANTAYMHRVGAHIISFLGKFDCFHNPRVRLRQTDRGPRSSDSRAIRAIFYTQNQSDQHAAGDYGVTADKGHVVELSEQKATA